MSDDIIDEELPSPVPLDGVTDSGGETVDEAKSVKSYLHEE